MSKPISLHTVDYPQSLGLTSILNARELGGYRARDGRRVRPGLLLRTAALGTLSEADTQTLLQKHRLSAVVDLRGDGERQRSPEPAWPGVRSCHLPVLPETQGFADTMKQAELTASAGTGFQNEFLRSVQGVSLTAMERMFAGLYPTLVTHPHAVTLYRSLFPVLLEAEGAVLWHCSQGKDRTGVAAALILSALGVDRETILADYELSNRYVAQFVDRVIAEARQETDDEQLLGAVRLINEVKPAYLRSAFDAIDEKYASVEAYLEAELGVTPEQRRLLQDKYLTA